MEGQLVYQLVALGNQVYRKELVGLVFQLEM
jgi:hypothetical protein